MISFIYREMLISKAVSRRVIAGTITAQTNDAHGIINCSVFNSKGGRNAFSMN